MKRAFITQLAEFDMAAAEESVDRCAALRQIDGVKRTKRKRARKPGMMDPKVLMAYDRWVARNLDKMSRKYPHKVIAVYRGKLVAVGDSFKEVYDAARAQGIKEFPFAMEVPTAEDMDAIL